MVDTIHPVDAVTGSPSYSGRMLRQLNAVAFGGATASRPLGGRSGVRPGTSPTTVSATATTWTCGPLSGVADVETAAEAGLVTFALDASATGAITAASASIARQDLLYIQIDIPVEDGSAAPVVTRKYVAGTIASTDPALPVSRAFAIARINVPIAGGGAPTVTWIAPYAVAAGGVLPVRSSAEYPAHGSNAAVYDVALKSVLVSDGTAWVPVGGAVPGGRVKRNAATATLSAGAWTVFNNSTYFQVDQPAQGIAPFNGLWTCSLAGVYDVEGGFLFDSAVNAIFAIKKNSISADALGAVAISSASGSANLTSGVIKSRVRLGVGDTLVYALYVSASAVWNTAVSDASFFGVRYVEPLR